MSTDIPDDDAQLLAAYESGPELLRTAVDNMTRDQVRQRPVPGKWSTLEVVCHIGDTEQFYADRIKRTLAMNRPLLMAVEDRLYLEALRYDHRDCEEELALISLTRSQLARVLKAVPTDSWQRTAVHSETGLTTLRELVQYAVGHLNHHLPFIEEKRRALSGG